MDKSTEQITISVKEYENLKQDSRILSLLHQGGVDNWEWYGESLSELYDEEED